MAKLTRNLFVPFLDTTRGGANPTWVPIDLSTVFELSFNPQEETYGYICYANDVTETNSYAPEMEQEIVLDNANPMYKFMKEFCLSLPTGSAAKVPCLVALPDDTTALSTDGMLWGDAVVSPGALNTVDGKLTFTLKLNGDPQRGTVAGVGTDTVTFTPANAPATPGE